MTLPTRADVESAAARLGEKVRHTPTLVLHGDELDVPYRVVLKLELLQHTGSFKARGALNSVMSLDPSGGRVVAASGTAAPISRPTVPAPHTVCTVS